ncbi:MAG: elongation factor Ts [Spirosomataceae bacterium]|jgi:elongation factor Ts
MKITAADVNALRQKTGAGMMDCKKALVEAEGDSEKAVEILRKAGQKVAAKRADNETSEGIVLVNVSESGDSAKVLALACETEPVSNVDDFKDLAAIILEAGVKHNAKNTEELLAIEMEDGETVQEHITNLIGKIGEKVIVSDFVHMEGEKVVAYIHSNKKAAGLVSFSNVGGADVEETGRDISMQIVAMKPVALSKDDVDPSVIDKEIEIGKDQARQEGKPEAILEKIAMGKLGKFFKENTLLSQQFVKDPSISIEQLLEQTQKGLKINSFKRIQIG